MTTQEFKQMRKMFPSGWEYSDIPAYIRRRDKEDVKEYIAPEYFAPGEFDEDISPEYRKSQNYGVLNEDEVENRRSPEEEIKETTGETVEDMGLQEEAEDLDQERLCQDAQDDARAESNYIDRAVEAGKEEGREISQEMLDHFNL